MNQHRRLLLVRIDKVGDMVLTMPAIRAVRGALPDAHLTLLASPYNAVVVEGWDAVDEVQVYDPAAPLGQRLAAARRLRRARFDACLVFSPGVEGYLLARLAAARARIGLVYSRRILDRLVVPLLLTGSEVARVDEAVRSGAPVPHLVQQTMAVVERAGLPAGRGDLEIVRNPEATRWAGELVGRYCAAAGPIVALHLSPKWFESGWSPADVTTLVERLISAEAAAAVVLTCGSRDGAAMEALERGCRAAFATGGEAPSGRDGAVGRDRAMLGGRAALVGVDYPRWVALLGRSDVVVTRDTAAIHLASALGRPVVAVYAEDGFSRNSQQFAPWRVPHRIIRDGPFDQVAREVVEAAGFLAIHEKIGDR